MSFNYWAFVKSFRTRMKDAAEIYVMIINDIIFSWLKHRGQDSHIMGVWHCIDPSWHRDGKGQTAAPPCGPCAAHGGWSRTLVVSCSRGTRDKLLGIKPRSLVAIWKARGCAVCGVDQARGVIWGELLSGAVPQLPHAWTRVYNNSLYSL